MLSEEIGQLRRIGKSDSDIVALLGQTLGKPIAAEALAGVVTALGNRPT